MHFSARILTPILLATPSLYAQSWIDFSEDASRLTLSSVSVNDNQEKDIIADDFDQDGDEDIVILRKLPFSNAGARTNVLLMNENGNLIERTSTLAPELLDSTDDRDVLSFDANGDGWKDLVTATTFFEQPRLYINQGNTGPGGSWAGFQVLPNAFPTLVPGPKFCAVYEGDVDLDGDLDLYFSDYDSPLEDQLMLNNGDGTFVNNTSTAFPTGANNSVFGTGSFICDMNGDSFPDIIKVSGMFDPMELLINSGPSNPGVFTQVQQLTGTGFGGDAVYMARVKDYNNDGRSDIYVIDDGDDFVLYNMSTNPNGTINTQRNTTTGSLRTDGFGGNIKAEDFDLDGDLDVAVCDVDVDISNCNSSRLALLENLGGNSGFVDNDPSLNMPWNAGGTHDVGVLDIDGDGFTDLFIATCSGYRVFLQDPFANATTYGQGCGGPMIGNSGGAPFLGNGGFGITVSGAGANAPSAVWIGFQQTITDLSVIAPGCSLLNSIDAALAAGNTNGLGQNTFPFGIANDPSANGLSIYAQWAVIGAGGPLLGIGKLSDGLQMYLSNNSL